MSRRTITIVVAAVAMLAAAGIGLAVALSSAPQPEPSAPEAAAPATAESTAGAPSTPVPPQCPEPTVTVADAEALQDALDGAQPGDAIAMEPGSYRGEFEISVPGTESDPIWLCGTPEVVLDGGSTSGGYVVHLDGASHWRLVGFTVTNGQKGVMVDATVGTRIEGLTVTEIGDEAIHLRNFSTDNVVAGNTISVTGLRREKFGEGIYVGTAESNWCDISNCEPDRSDRNIIEGNIISETTSEAIDIKEGTTGGIVRHNTFDGSAMTEADSWVDVKGNEWLIEANAGTNSAEDGFQTHEILEGWGDRNVFRGNRATLNGSGYGFAATPALGNVIECSNSAEGAGSGLSNVACVPA